MNSNQICYLNTASVGILNKSSIAAVHRFQEISQTNPSTVFFEWMASGLVELRKNIATLIHSKEHLVAFTPNFSYSLLAITDSLRERKSKVLLYREDYPSLNMPFELGGFEVHYVDNEDGFHISIGKIREIIQSKKIEILAISHVQFLTGFTIDLQALGQVCLEANVILIVDTTQSMGAVEIDFGDSNIDVMISSSYKWLNGGLGSAVLCVQEQFLQKFPPRIAGFGSMLHSDEGWTYSPSITSYEPGHLNPLGLLQLGESIKERLSQSVQAVEKHNLGLIQRLVNHLKGTPYLVDGGIEATSLRTILCFDASKALYDHLITQNIITTWRKGKIRVSPHYHNTEKDIDTLTGCLL